MTSKQKTSNPDTFAHGPLLKRIKADLYHKKKRGGSLHPACHEMLRLGLNQSLVQHGIGDLQEAADRQEPVCSATHSTSCGNPPRHRQLHRMTKRLSFRWLVEKDHSTFSRRP